MKRIFTMIVLIAMLAAVFAVPVGAQGESRSYLLMANGNKLPANLVKSVSAAGGVVTQTIPEVGLAVVTSSDPNFAVRAAKISGLRSVSANLTMQWINPNFQEAVEIDAANPPFSGDDDFFFDLQWGHDAVDAPEAWDAGYRGAGVLVAVLDTGFDMDHPDLAPNINYALSTSFVPGEPVDYTLPDTFSHGTHVAGTIAAADNAFGVIGIAPEAELMLVKVLSDSGSGSFASVIAGIVHAANSGADVINMSLGRSGGPEAPLIGEAIRYAVGRGAFVAVAAGNDYERDNPVERLAEQAAPIEGAMAVAAVGRGLTRAYYSGVKPYVEIAAPGGDHRAAGSSSGAILQQTYSPIFTDTFTGGPLRYAAPRFDTFAYVYYQGTSMATPHVSGLAALLMSQGITSPQAVEAAIKRFATDKGAPGVDQEYGSGLINPRNTLRGLGLIK